MNNKDYLNHYGILGMKWGRRRGGIASSKPDNYSDDHVKKVTLKKKKLHEMSNAELKTLNERMQLENTYRTLRKNDISSGRSYVNKLLSIGKTANEIYTLYNSPAVKQVKAMMNKA